MSDDGVRIFEEASPMLRGLAYRMLGSWAEAEDAVQDTFLKWQQADRRRIENPPAWLTTICTRRCIDLLRAAHRTRVDYVGTWLPEPVDAASISMAEAESELPSSLTTAFLLMLERLTPRERAAYLLHEIFEIDYPEIARVLEMREDACRKLVSRARANIGREHVRHVTPPERQQQLLTAFQQRSQAAAHASLQRSFPTTSSFPPMAAARCPRSCIRCAASARCSISSRGISARGGANSSGSPRT